MRTTRILTALILVYSTASFGQNTCGTDELMKEQYEASPDLQEIVHKGFLHAANPNNNAIQSRAAIVVPTVVHIIHDNGIGNISDEQILDGLRIMNEDYTRTNPDTSETRSTSYAPFKQFAGAMDIEFKLAKIDPNGNCTNGILRVNAPELSYEAGEECKYTSNGGSSAWPKDSYFNIWVVNSIGGDVNGLQIAGYAYYPYGAANNDGYGILIGNQFMGTIETAENSDGRTLTHEMGHSLGLAHIFNVDGASNGCHSNDCYANGDYSCDTPPQAEYAQNCNDSWNSCNLIPAGDAYGTDVHDQIENYMSYNSCQNMYSMDQVNMMETNFASISFLSSLISGQNILDTGVDDPDILCLTDFVTPVTSFCSGTTILFEDLSFHGITDWTWSVSPGVEGVDYNFMNGTDANSQDPEIQFITSGSYDIELLASDGVNSQAETKVSYITVLTEPLTIPFLEDFESYSTLNNTDWIVLNHENNEGFELNTTFGHTGTNCVRLMNFGEAGDNKDELISSAVDLSSLDSTDNITMSFRYAYKRRIASSDEKLKVMTSTDCGETWSTKITRFGWQMSSTTQNSSWEPSSQNDWTTQHVQNIFVGEFVENFRYKFVFEGETANNFFLDNINIYPGGPTEDLSLSSNELGFELALYPNPTQGEINLRFNSLSGQEISMLITDITGKQIISETILPTTGLNKLAYDMHSFSRGMYYLTFGNKEGVTTLPFVFY